MQLIYRGQRYQKRISPTTISKIKFSCVYRGVSYQANRNFSYPERKPNDVQLTYRGVTYRRML
jgi:hypothetical protein